MWSPSRKTYQIESIAEEPLLEKDEENNPYIAIQKAARQRQRRGFCLHTLLVLLYSTIFLFSWLNVRNRYMHGPELVYDPVRSAIQYETQTFDHTQVFFNSTPKPYSGVPNPQKDAAWEELLKNFDVRVSEDEMRRLGKLDDNIPLPDGGYYGSLTVYHQLHCIWRVQKALYPKYYWADLSDEEAFLNLGHSEHCLDVMRQSILCNADTSIITMKWDKFAPSPIADSSNKHECVNWKAINDWAAERFFDPFQPNYLMHPTLGYPYGDERGNRIGVAVASKNKHFNEEKVKEILKYTSHELLKP